MHPFGERQEEGKGGAKQESIKQQRHEGRVGMRRPGAVRIQAGARDCISAGTHTEHS